MRAAVWRGEARLEVTDDWPAPEPDEHAVVVDVAYCGFCGSDAHILSGRYRPAPPPRLLGHEVSGVISRVGPAVSGLAAGDRVACNLFASCGSCRQCQLGRPNFCLARYATTAGFAAQALYRPEQVFALPDSVSLVHGALLEPVATVLHALEQANPAPGESLLVLGAGALGVLAAALARIMGAGRVTVSEPGAYRRGAVAPFADTVLDPTDGGLATAAKQAGVTEPDIVLDLAGVPSAVEEGVELLGPGGRLVIAGVYPDAARLSLRPAAFFERELTVVGSLTSRRTAQRALALLPRLDLDSMITDIVDLPDINKAYERHSKGQSLKVLVTPNGA